MHDAIAEQITVAVPPTGRRLLILEINGGIQDLGEVVDQLVLEASVQDAIQFVLIPASKDRPRGTRC